MSYFVLPGQLGAEPTTCPGGMKQTHNGVSRCIYPCKPGDTPESGCYHLTCPEGEVWYYPAGACLQEPGTEACPGTFVNGKCVVDASPSGKCPPPLVNVSESFVPECVTPAEAERIKAERAAALAAALKAQQDSPVQWIKVVGVLAAIGVVGGLAWYSTRSSGSAKANARRFYSQAHYDRVCPPPDTPGAAEERIRYRLIAEQAVREREHLFPVLTKENAGEAMAWQEARIQELLRSRG